MNKMLIISENVAERVALPENNELTVVVTADIREKIEKSITEKDKLPILAVIFISLEEYEALDHYLTVLPFSYILYQLVVFGTPAELESVEFSAFHTISEYRSSNLSPAETGFIARKTLALLEEIWEDKTVQDEYLAKLIDTRQDQEDLINIGKALSSEKDSDQLLTLILFLSKKITGADAGSIYLVEEGEDGKERLRFKYSHTFSRDIPLEEFLLDMNEHSIAGCVAVTGEVVNISNVYDKEEIGKYSFTHNSTFDKTYDYISRSILSVPMRNHVDKIIGVIQLLNSKEGRVEEGEAGNEAFSIKLTTREDFESHVVKFDSKYDGLLEAIAGQAAVAIENNRMIKQIQSQFEEFVKASVTAIESRDPATSGHSFRVAEICTAMARSINDIKDGYLGEYYFDESSIRELEFAALLHDFGKVYIDLAIFKKAKKLFPMELDNLVIRLDYLYRFVELQYSDREQKLLREQVEWGGDASAIETMMLERRENLNKIKSIKEQLLRLNEPTVSDDDPEVVLHNIMRIVQQMECIGIDGEKIDVIRENDKINLSIKRGSLNPLERKEIESHVVHTYNFVSKIPWPPEYKNIPEIALRHHETLDGSGYPDHIQGRDNLLLQSRIMTIADIYDALAASDRPYKKAVPLERVLKILQEEADRGKLDKDLVSVFIDKKIYEQIDIDSFKGEGE